jgi:hypothetical protein
MTHPEATQLLAARREGADIPLSQINQALRLTGDLDYSQPIAIHHELRPTPSRDSCALHPADQHAGLAGLHAGTCHANGAGLPVAVRRSPWAGQGRAADAWHFGSNKPLAQSPRAQAITTATEREAA